MREPFNTTCDIYAGPGAAVPGSFVGTFDCRFVVEDGIFSTGPGCPEIVAYLTIEDYQPVGMWENPFFGANPDLSDRVEVATRPGEEFWVVYTDIIVWKSQSAYYRSYLSPIPAPPMGVFGGILFGGAAAVSFVRIPYIEGGILFGGAAAVSFNDIVIPSGGILFGGAAAVSFTLVIPVSGGILFGGAAAVSFTPGSAYRIYDKFNVSNQANVGRTPDTANAPGNTWLNTKGTFSVVSNQLEPTATAPNDAIASIDNSQLVTFASIDVVLPSSALLNMGALAFRVVDSANLWYALIMYDSGNATGLNNRLLLGYQIAGAGTNVSVVASTNAVGTPNTLTITDDGTNIIATGGGATISYASTLHNTATKVGTYTYAQSVGSARASMDEFKVN